MNKELASDTTLSHYRIVTKIGEGGMGEVYLARDTQLDRTVALKILPENVAEDRTRLQRFIQEAKAASALNHPNILTVHEIGKTDGTYFIATEYIEGETLRQHLSKDRLSLNDALDISIQVTSALATAHTVWHTLIMEIYLGAAYALSGQRESAQAILKRLKTSSQYVSPAKLAILYAALGERDQAFASLERAYADRDLQLQFLGVDPDYDSLRSDSRFSDLLRQLAF